MTVVSAKVDYREIACQQVLQQDGSVYSVQWLVVPENCADPVTGRFLLARYLELVRTGTLNLVRPVSNADGIQFRLLGSSLALLRFAPAEHLCGEEGEAVHLRTTGGLLVRKGETGPGRFSFLTEREEGGLRITVQLRYCAPLLLGGGRPSLLRRLFFRATQGRFHKAITVRFLSELYRELTGEKARLRLKKVRVKEGRDI